MKIIIKKTNCWLVITKKWSIGITTNKHRVDKKKGIGSQVGSNGGVKLWKSWNAMLPFIGMHLMCSFMHPKPPKRVNFWNKVF